MIDVFAPLVNEIAQLLVEWNWGTRGLVDASGTAHGSIWIGDLPQEAAEGLMLIPVPSPPPERYIDHQLNVIDFWYRSDHPSAAYEAMQTIYQLFHRKEQYQTTNWYIFNSFAIGQPEDAGFDDERGKLLRLSIQFQCRNLGVIS